MHSKEIYQFSQFRLEVSERRLLRNGKKLPLPDKAFDTLCELVRRHGELVTKDQLMSAVWPGCAVEENNLDQKISTLRRLLGDQNRKGTIIETVRGHGYRFIPEVTQVIDDFDERPSPSKDRLRQVNVAGPSIPPQAHRIGNLVAVPNWSRPDPVPAQHVNRSEGEIPEHEAKLVAPLAEEAPRRNTRRVFLFASAICLLFLLGLGAYVQVDNSTGSPVESIAVLPISNQTEEPSFEYLTDGLTESLIGSLSQVPGLSVKARNSVFRYKVQTTAPTEAGRELAVSAVLTGDLIRYENRIILTLELIETKTGNAIWSERFDREVSNLIALQGEVARKVSDKLRSRLTGAEKNRIARVYTADEEANKLFLQGRYFLNKRTPDDIGRSIALFERATLKDPEFAKAFAAAAEAYLILPDYSPGFSRAETKEKEQQSRVAFLRARELDDSLPEVQTLAAAHSEVDWDVESADKGYQRAIDLDLNFATAHHWYSRFLGAVGRNDEAIAHINKALELDPFSRSIAFNAGARLADARRFDEAIAQYMRVLEMEPEHLLTHLGLALVYDSKGQYLDAIEEYRIAATLSDKNGGTTANERADELKIALARGGPAGYWRKRLEHSRAQYDNGAGSNYRIAVCLVRLGEIDLAFEHLNRSFAAHEPDLFWIRTEAAFDGVQSDPRFIEIIRRIGVG